jgi:hypothetical protein
MRKITYCCLARAQSGGSFADMEKLRKLQREKKISKVRYMGARECFLGKWEGCVYIYKGTMYKE